MKLILLISILLSSYSTNASNCFPVGKEGAKTVYIDDATCSLCQRQERYACYDITDCPPDLCELKTFEVDDTDKPLYSSKLNQTRCDGRENCFKLLAGHCEENQQGYINEDMTGIFCLEILGYEKKSVTKLVRNEEKIKAIAEAKLKERAAKEQLIADLKLCMDSSAPGADCLKKALKLMLENR